MSDPKSTVPDHLEEVSTEERIKLVEGDNTRRRGQLGIAFVLITFMLGYLTYYTVFLADEAFRAALAADMRVLVIMGIGAALAIFGLGRTVGRKT
jgi:hypothetical protein